MPTASAANRGALSAADWSTFNTKVGGVTATSPLFSSGGSTPNITIQQSSGSQAGYLSSTDWTTFNNKQVAGSYITSLTGEATATGPGAAAVTLDNAAVTAKILTGVNITGGTILSTDSILTGFGKLQNQVNGLIGGSIYQGTWNANTNTPTLTSSVGTAGYYYIVSVAGNTNLNGITDWQVGDWAIFNGGVWQKVDNTDSVISVNGQTGAVSLTTDNISEGVTNLYFTNTRARAALSFVAGSGAYNSSTGAITIPTNTSQLTNGANFITLASLSGTAPISYNSGTGAISITQAGTASNGYLSSTDWNTFNNKQSTISLTTTGTSGAATFSANTLNIPQYQGVLTNPVTGTGTTNYLPKFTGASTIGNSLVYDNGTRVTIDGDFRVALADANINLQGTSKSYLLQIVDSDNRFRIYDNTSNVERLTITSAGNVGIGTTSPTELLDVRNSYREPTSGEFTQLLSSTTTQDAGRGGSLGFGGFTNGTSGYTTFSGIKGFKENGDGGNTAGALAFYTRVNGGAINERVRITSGGNVGIGLTNPSDYLSTQLVVSSPSFGGITIASTNATNTNYLCFARGTTTNLPYIGSISYNHTSDFMAFATTATEKMRITSGGNVLVGTTTNRLRLTVSGSDANAPTLGTASGTMLLCNAAGTSEYGTMFGIAATGYGWIQQQRVDATATAYFLSLQPSGGNLLVGTTTDSGYKLDVNGTGRFSGALTGTSASFSDIVKIGSSYSYSWASGYSISQLGYGTAVWTSSSGNSNLYLSSNLYYNAGFKIAADATLKPSYLQLYNGALTFSNAAIGAIDSTFTPIDLFTIASTGAATFSSSVTASSLIKSGGTSSQFLMADGSVNTSILPSGAYLPLAGGTLTGALGGTSATFSGNVIIGGSTPVYLKFNVQETSANRVAILYRGTQGADASMVTAFGTPYLSIGAQENLVNSIQTIGFGFTNGTSYIQPAEIGFQTTSISGYTLGDLVFATRGVTTNTAPTERLRIASTGEATFSSSVTATTLIVNTSGQSRTISTFYGAGSDGNNIFIGGGGLSSGTGGGPSTNGSYNTANGVNALYSNTNGSYNTANGVNALYSNTTGANNTANGVDALYNNTTGAQNTANGVVALRNNTTGASNTANGVYALYYNTTGVNNTANGVYALFSNTTGYQNTANGYQAGYGTGTNANTTGSNNIFIGNESVGVSATESNRTWIGNSLTTSTWLGGNVLIGTTTDAGYKLDVNGTGRFSGALSGTSVVFSSSIVGTGGVMSLQKNGSGTVGSGAYFTLYNTATTEGMLWQLNASNNIDFWGLTSNSFTASPVITLTRAGAATFSSSVTASQGNFNQIGNAFAITMTNRNANQTWGLIVDTDAVDDKILGFQSSYGFTPFYALKLEASGGAATFSSSIKTAAPSGGTAKPFKIGAAATVTPTSQNRTIEIEIDGTTYYLTAKTTND